MQLGIGLFVGFLIGLFLAIGLNFIGVESAAWTDGITAISTATIAVLTIVLAIETWRLRILQNQQISQIRKNSVTPLVLLKLEISPADPIFLNMVVVNKGVGIAKDVSFKIIDLSKKENCGSEELSKLINSKGFIEQGISSLGMNEIKSTYLFNFPDFTEKYGDEFYDVSLSVEIKYQDIDGNSHCNTADLKMSEYKELSTLGGPDPLYQIAKNTKVIANNTETGRVDNNK